MPEPDDSERSNIQVAAQEAAQARDDAVDARHEAEEAREQAERARDEAESAQQEAEEAEISPALASELLINPADVPDTDDDNPFGEPGPPVSRRAPFYIGFMATMGALAALVVGLAIRQVTSVIVLVLVAVFLAVGLNPIVEALMHRGLRRKWAVLVVSIGLLGAVTLFVVALVPVLRDQITALIENAPAWLDDLARQRWVKDLDAKYDIIATLKERVQDPDIAQRAFGSVYTVGIAVLTGLLNAFLIFVLTLYFLSALPQIKRACYTMAPASRRVRVTHLGDEILRRVGGYVAGAFVVALCAGASSFVFLEIVGLGRYALALALLVTILDFIPLIGATLGATAVALIGLATSLHIGVACVIFFVIYQQIENYAIYPRVMRSSVDVPGVVTVIAVLIGGSMIGVVGAMLATPPLPRPCYCFARSSFGAKTTPELAGAPRGHLPPTQS